MERNIPYLTISEVVDEFFASNMNNSRKYYENYLIHAKWVWKKLFRQTIFEVKHKLLRIDKSTTPHSVVFPTDIIRFINLSFQDEKGKIVQLTEKDSMAITPKIANNSKECGCKCGCGEPLCGGSNQFIVRTNALTIDGKEYLEKIWTRREKNGDVIEVRQTPVKDYTTPTAYNIIYMESTNRVCNLEVQACGCVKNTTRNRELICSLSGLTWQQGSCESSLSCFEGYDIVGGFFKLDGKGRAYLRGYDSSITHVELSYQTNGECPYEEMMIPEIAVDAMHLGMMWRMKALSSGIGRLEMREAKRMFLSEVTELEQFLQPVRMEEFLAVQGILPKWGGGHYDEVINYIPKLTTSTPATLSEIGVLLDQKITNLFSASGGAVGVNPPLGTEGYSYIHYQDVASKDWVIDHKLSFYPNVTCVDQYGEKIEGVVRYPTVKKITVHFSEPVTGFAYCS